jgi:hypothetical protein
MGDGVPDGVELPSHDVVEAPEEAVLQPELRGVDLVGGTQLLDACRQQLRDGAVDGHHGRAHRQRQLNQLLDRQTHKRITPLTA